MPTVNLTIRKGEIDRLVNSYRATTPRMRQLGFYLLQQTKRRFATAGASGGVKWAQKWLKGIGADDGRAILTGPTGFLLNSFASEGRENEAELYSFAPYARVHQLGTQGKGGTLPDIRPRKAKALFIPISDRAMCSQRVEGGNAAYVRSLAGGDSTDESAIRAGIRHRKVKGSKLGAEEFFPLVKGRIFKGRLQKWQDGMWKDGKPDFIFLRKVSITRRPMLPDSQIEQDQQMKFVLDLLSGEKPSTAA